MKAGDLRNGMAVNINNEVWLIMSQDHVKPGKGPAYQQVKLKNIKTGAHQEKRLRTSEEVEQANLDRRELEYLYSDSDGAIFMDSETFDQLTIPKDVLGKAMDFLKPNGIVQGMVYNGNVINVELPAAVDLEVTDTPPGIKDATKTNQLKEATLETGFVTRVPPFIKIGEVVRISTESGDYLSRANA